MKKFIIGIGNSIKIISYSVFLLVLFYFLFAFLLSIIPVNNWQENTEPKTETIYLISNGIHLDFIFESKDLKPYETELEIKSKHKYIGIGWGDEGFYLNTKTWDDLEMKTMFNALFWKSQAAMHVTRYQNLSNNSIKLNLSKAQLEVIIDYAIASFDKNTSNNIEKIPDAAYFKNDNFYKAKGNYNCIKTCNEWVNLGLKKAKIKTSVWSPFDKGILYQIQ